MNLGDIILYASLVIGVITILLLFKGDHRVKWFSRAFTLLLSVDLILLIYYFLLPELTINYVWTFTSNDLPVLYKVLGAFAGQQGTLLFWSFVISLQTLWLSEKNKKPSEFVTKINIVAMAIGLFFVGLTLVQSPFLTIYQLYSDIPSTLIPEDGSGLNPLLITIWMALHPPIIFIGYAMMTLPFAVSIVYLFKSVKNSNSINNYKTWLRLAYPWARASWLLLTAGIAIGAVWSYEVLGWGGFWAWDPVETSSLIPWLLLTAGLHSMVDHSGNKRKFSILTPSIIALSFVLVVFAALVTRSGFFESIHAFGAGSTGTYLLIFIAVTTIPTIILASMIYLKSKKEDGEPEELSFINRTNIFYLAITLLIILTFISFWGIIFPAINKLILGTKVAVTKDFFDIWNAPFMMGIMLLMGLGIHYRTHEKKRVIKIFILFAIATIILMFIKPSDVFTYVHYTNVVGPDKPLLYTLIGSASILSIIPPTIYIFYSSIEKIRKTIRPLKIRNEKIKQIGALIIHLGVVFIVLGYLFSANFSAEFSTTINIEDRGQIRLIPDSSFSVSLLDYNTDIKYGEGSTIFGLTINEFFNQLVDDIESQSVKDTYTVNGRVDTVFDVDSYTYIRLMQFNRELWIATETINVQLDTTITVTGFPMLNFTSSTLNTTFPVIIFSSTDDIGQREIITRSEVIRIAIYEGNIKIAEGTPKYIQYELQDSDVTNVMIGRGALRDVYVIFSGSQEGIIPVTVKIIPMMTSLWLGITLMMIGVSLILLFDTRFRESKVVTLNNAR